MSLFTYVAEKNITQPVQLEIGFDKVVYDRDSYKYLGR